MVDRATAVDGASLFYPALTDAEQGNAHELIASYRHAMGRTRIMAFVVGGVLLSWGIYHSRREAGKHPHKRRHLRHHYG